MLIRNSFKIFTAILSFSANSAFAAAPTVDATTNALTAAYAKAIPPKTDQLKIGRIWSCKVFYVSTPTHGSGGLTEYKKTFRFTDINILIAADVVENNFPDFYMRELMSDDKGVLAGYVKDSSATVYVRMTSTGSLILERVLDVEPNPASADLASQENPKQTVQSYMICPVDLVQQ